MTVSSQTSNETFDGNGVTTVWDLPFRFFSNSDVFVYRIANAGTPSQSTTLLAIGTDYTLTGAGLPEQFGTAPGKITTTVPVAATDNLFVERAMDIEQLTDITNQGKFFPEVHEDVFDRLTMLIQQNGSTMGRALKVPPYDPNPADLPSVPARADKLLSFDTAGNPIAVAAVGGSATDLALLLASTATGNGDAMIGVLQPLAGARTMTQHDKNAQTVHIDDFPATPANTWLSRAIDGTPAGGTLKLGKGPYLANFTKIRNDIRIIGEGLPAANAGRTALTGGTIIQGKFRLSGNNIAVELLGVDCGIDVCNAINGGVAMDALVINGQNPALITNVIVRDVCGLCKSPTDLVHPMLLEALNDALVSNVHGYLGFTGPVIKAQRCIARGLYGYKNSQSGVQIKSNSYAPCNRLIIDGIVVSDEGLALANSVGILIYAEDAQLANLIMGNSIIRGFDNSCALNGLATVINDVDLGNIICETPLSFGLVSDGPVQKISAGTIKIIKPVSGRFVRLSADNLGFNIDTIEGTAPAGLTLADSIQLGGVFSVMNIDTTVNYVPNTPTGVVITPHAGFPRSWRIVNYRATLNVNSGASGYRNGWGTADGDTVRVWVENGTVFMRGTMTIPVAGSRPGAEQFYQLSALIAPPLSAGQYRKGELMIFTSGTVANVMTTCWVDLNGIVSAPFLSNTAHVPTAAVQATIDMSWPLN